MAKSLKHSQFLQMWYNRCGFKNKFVENHMEEIYEGLLNTIREEVRLNGELKLKNLGKFYMISTGGFEKHGGCVSKDGTYFVEKHYLPKFTSSQNFKDYVNDAIVSKEGRRKKKTGKLTKLDEELLLREEEKRKTDVRRMLERKRDTGESISAITKDTRMQINRGE
jgi:nucleoid DNA-binding protein